MEKSIQSYDRRLALLCHLITLSARYSTDCGIFKPICLAVFRLIANSNFTGYSTGKSAGFVPFKNSVHVVRRPAKSANFVGRIGHQPARLDPGDSLKHSRLVGTLQLAR